MCAGEAWASSPADMLVGCSADDAIFVCVLVPAAAALRHPSLSRTVWEHWSSAHGDLSRVCARMGLSYLRPCRQDAAPTMSLLSVSLSLRLQCPSRHPALSRTAAQSATSLFAPSSNAPAKPSSVPCRRPHPSTRAAACNDGTSTEKAPWAKEEAGHSSPTGATGLSTELILECSPTFFSICFLLATLLYSIFFQRAM